MLPPDFETHKMHDDKKSRRVLVTRETEPGVWKRLEGRVALSLPDYTVEGIVRLQNVELWRKFAHYRWQLAQKYLSAHMHVNERELFHYANPETRRVISENSSAGGFDPRVAKEMEYGTGTYFAEHAAYAVSHGQGWLAPSKKSLPSTAVTLLVAQVVLGDSSKDFGPRCMLDHGDRAADQANILRGLMGFVPECPPPADSIVVSLLAIYI